MYLVLEHLGPKVNDQICDCVVTLIKLRPYVLGTQGKKGAELKLELDSSHKNVTQECLPSKPRRAFRMFWSL